MFHRVVCKVELNTPGNKINLYLSHISEIRGFIRHVNRVSLPNRDTSNSDGAKRPSSEIIKT